MNDKRTSPIWRALCYVDRRNGSFLRIADVETKSDKSHLRWISNGLSGNSGVGQLFGDDEAIDRYRKVHEDFVFMHLVSMGSQDAIKVLKGIGIADEAEDPEIIEVIPIRNAHNRYEFRVRLNENIVYSGNPTQKVLLAYKVKSSVWEGVLVSTEDLSQNRNGIVLNSRLAKSSSPVPYYRFSASSVLTIQTRGAQEDRYIYQGEEVPASVGSMPLCTDEYLALDYMEWYWKRHDDGISREEMTRMKRLMKRSFDAPESLDEYFSDLHDEKSVYETKKTILSKLKNGNDIEKLVKSIIKEDEEFYEDCRQCAVSLIQEEYADRKRVVQELIQKSKEEQERIQKIESRKSALNSEVVLLQNQKDDILAKLQNDVALHLGLKTVSSIRSEDKHASSPMPYLRGVKVSYSEAANPVEALRRNLKRGGVITDPSLLDNSYEDVKLSLGIIAGLYVTKMLSVDSDFVFAVANALSVAMTGDSAYYISVPSDCADVDSIVGACREVPSKVIVLDNVLDTVNEGLLFALSRVKLPCIFIFPIGARKNLRLIAPEVWNQILYVPTNGLVYLPQVSQNGEEKSLQRVQSDVFPTYGDFAEAEIGSVALRHDNLLPSSAVVLPAGLIYAYVDHVNDWGLAPEWTSSFSPEKWLESHETLLSYAYLGMQETLKFVDTLEDQRIASQFLRRIEMGSIYAN